MSKFTKKVSTVLVSVATVVSLSGAGALVPVAYGATTAELQAQINALLAQVAALQSQLSSSPVVSGTVPASLLSSGNLTVGSKGTVVSDLQKFLGMSTVTGFFGSLTKAALAKWQAGNGVSPAAGYFGSVTRAKLSSLSGGAAPVAGGTTPAPAPAVPAGSGLTVALASDQPAASLAPFNATRIPFTKVNLTASADGDVTVTGLTVQRTGLSEDAALAGVVLLNEDGVQLGLEKTLNSDHKVVVGESLVVKAGQTRTLTVAARRAAAGSRGGQTVSLPVVGVSTSAAVNATFPLTGTTHTVNETLTVGSLTSPTAGALDPGASQTKEVGTTNYTFGSIRVTAGSAEKVILKSVRWNQTGSAGKGDLANIKTYVDGVGYDVVVSADGKFYTSTFGTGILVDKGFNKEITIKGDVIGGSARKVDFDIDKRSDLYAVGETFGYGILPDDGTATSGTDDGKFHSATNPWWDSFEVNVSSGTLTVSKWNGVPAQNVAINLADQPMGGWTVEVRGEPISVGKMIFRTALFNNAGTAPALTDLDNVKLVDNSGKVLAGPVDASGDGTSGTITFTDTITFPVGVTNMKMVGKLATNFANNDTVDASTTPSSNWTTVTGQNTGNSITPSPTSGVSGSLMTVKSSSITISVSSVPIAQTVIAGSNQFEFARYILDTSASGEDLRLTSLPLEYNLPGGGSATDLTNCFLYDGSTKLNTANVLNPSAIASSTSVIFDGTGITLVKGTAKTLSFKCDMKSAATGGYSWGYNTTSSPAPTGLTSGQAVASGDITENGSVGQTMTAATSGTLTVALDTVASYLVVSPGDTVELARLKYSASNEDVNVKQVTLNISGAASNTPINLVNQEVTLWDGATKVGAAAFPGSEAANVTNRATGTLSSFVVPKDGSKVLTIKGTIAGISNSGPLTRSGDLLKVDYDGGGGLTSNYGIGVSSGQTVSPTSAVTSSTGVRIMKSYPSVAFVDLDSGEKTLQAGSARTLYKFKVTANKGDVLVGKFSFAVSSSTLAATTTNYQLYVYTDAFSSIDSQINSTGAVNNTVCPMGVNMEGSGASIVPSTSASTCGAATTSLKIPAGESRWFKLVASVGSLAVAGTTETLEVKLQGDAAFPVAHQTSGSGTDVGEMSTFGISGGSGVYAVKDNDFIWSPTSTTTASSADTNYLNRNDWTNGYGVLGLPGTDLTTVSITHQ